ncbi:MAG: recombinase family protein [Salinarimonas sp.]|nr:recombinase family protein [Salinarimonas sp.]
MLRAAIYARYSSDHQREASIEDQIEICRELIVREGWALSGTYSDRAMSGASHLRPGYQQILSDARAGKLDVVVAEALDRVSRDQEHVAAFFKQMHFCGVRMVTLAEGEISELHVGLKGTMNALFLKDLAAKTHRGLRGRVAQGRSAGGISYGYRVRREIDGNGEIVRGGREIDEDEAVVVRRIFHEFAAGASPNVIARRLNGEKIPGPGGRAWGDTTIRGHAGRGTGILRNALYAGKLVWNRQRFIKDPTTGKRLARPNPASAWIAEDVPELRIVDEELWQRVATRLGDIAASPRSEAIRSTRFWEKRRPMHLLTGLTRCGVCGGSLQAIGRDYLRCAKAHRNGTCNNRVSVRRGALEHLVIDALKHHLMAPELVEEFVSAFHEELNKARADQDSQRLSAQRRYEVVSRQIEGLVSAIAEGMRAPSLAAKLEALEAERKEAERALAMPAPTPVRLHPNLAKLYREKVAALELALKDESTRTEALTLARSLIEAVVLHPIEDRSSQGYEIELIGEIAQMVEVALDAAPSPTGNKKAARRGAALRAEERRSVKVVAGVGFEPTTFRL